MTSDVSAQLESVLNRVGVQLARGAEANSVPPEPYCDSLALIQLIAELEKEFGILLPASHIHESTFHTYESVLELVSSCIGEPSAVHQYSTAGAVAAVSATTIVDQLAVHARERPDYVCVTSVHGDVVQTLTYRELESFSTGLAIRLYDGDGEDTSVVGLLAMNDIASIVAIFGAMKAGLVCVFLNPSDPSRRLDLICEEQNVERVLRSPNVPDDVLKGAIEIELIEAHDDHATALPQLRNGDEALAFGTSGSTAASKFVLQSHRALMANATAVKAHFKLDGETVVAGGLPLHHVNGVHFTVMGVVNAGAHLILPQDLNPIKYRDLLDKYEPHISSVVPTVLEALLLVGRGWKPPAALRYFVSAAAPLSRDLAERIHNAWALRVVQGYGLTETTNFSTMLPVDLSDASYHRLMLEAEIPTIGIEMHGNNVEVLTPEGEVASEGVTGELCVRGHNVMEGYALQPELTSEAFSGGWFHTGDLGHWISVGGAERYFIISGRIKNVAKVGGEAVSLDEVERALISIDGVTDAGCVAVPHALLSEEVHAHVTIASAKLTVDAIRQELAERVPQAAMPATIVECEVIPRSATGKLQRGLLGNSGVQ